MRLLIIDTIATIIFFTVVATFTELVIAGMEPREVLTTRLIMIPMMVLTGRPYSAWRDWTFQKTKPKNAVMRIVVDVIAFMSFQLPVYAVTLVVAGADTTEIFTVLGSAMVFMVILSRPFGLFLEFARRLAGVAKQSMPSD